MKISGAIFDMDGTMINSTSFWNMIYNLFGKKYLSVNDFRPTAEHDRAMRTLVMRDAAHLLHDAYGIGDNGDALLEEMNQIIVDFYSNIVELKPGVRELLEEFFKNGVKTCIASATDTYFLNIVVKRFGLDKYFPLILSCSDIGKGKEFPDVFLAAQSALGTPKESTWVFEDSLTAIKTANAAGFNTVGVFDEYAFDVEEVPKYSKLYLARGESFDNLLKNNRLEI